MLRIHTAIDLSQDLYMLAAWGKMHCVPLTQVVPEQGRRNALNIGIEENPPPIITLFHRKVGGSLEVHGLPVILPGA